jgi:hypothetical protein
MGAASWKALPRSQLGPRRIAAVAGLVILIWAAYTALQIAAIVFPLDEGRVAALEFLPGLLAVSVLLAAGFSRQSCFLRFALPSRGTLLALGAFSLMWPLILATGRWTGWNWQAALTQGSGGLSQELFFRAALLPVLLAVFRGRPWPALTLHTALFAVWHAGAFLVTPPGMIAGPVSIVAASLIAGLVWGWVTLHDRTVLWAALHHSLLWVIGSMFFLGPPE